MYPYYSFIVDNLTGVNYRFSVDSYQQGISEDSFRRVLSKTPFALQKKLGSIVPYKVAFRHRYESEWEDMERVLTTLNSTYLVKPFIDVGNLYQLYDLLKYEKSTKKFNGVSYTKFLLNRIQEVVV